MDEGRIVEEGTHKELIDAQGRYWRMTRGLRKEPRVPEEAWRG